MYSKLLSQINFKEDLYSRVGLFLLVGVGFAGLLILPFTISSDGYTRFEFMDALVHRLQLIPMKYSSIGPILSLPVWLVATFFNDPMPIIARYNLLLYIGILWVLFQWLKARFDPKFLITFLFLLSFATMFPGHLINYFGEVFSALFLALGTVGLVIGKNRVGWICMFLAVINSPALLLPFALVVLYWCWESRQLRYLALVPICFVLIVLESRLRMGSFVAVFQAYLSQDHGNATVLPYSGRAGYSYPFPLGVLSILFSFGKGLVFYCPGLILIGWAWKSIEDPVERKMMTLWLLITAGLVLAYASWWSWYGGWYWGPRFFLFASFPAAWVLAKLMHAEHQYLLTTLTALLFVTLSLWVGVNGVVFQQKTLDVCTQHHFALESLCWYVPEFSPLIRPFIARTPFDMHDKLILMIYGGLWLYAVMPLLVAAVSGLKVAWERVPSVLRLPTWRF